MTRPPEDIVKRMERVADELNRRVRTIHERVACPKCYAPVGERCRYASPPAYCFQPDRAILKHPHRERWSQEVPPR